ncbi:mitochondrial import inner membrane translocase subunit Tim50p [Trichomonascus vanleenenianus]|uniref:protein translocase subunit TIM50 n=1 Tax=Trichomonascus vanleenenianus TaxID=2268995 RepID=UPI003ECAAED3
MRSIRALTRVAPLARATIARTSRVGHAGVRFYSEEKKPEAAKKSDSILTDDLLAQAGMEVPEKDAPKQEQASGEEAEGGASEEQKKRWAGTAKKSSDKSSTDLKRERRSNMAYFAMLGMALGYTGFLAREWDDEEEAQRHSEVPEGYSPAACYGRVAARVSDLFNYFNDPVFEKLLPDPLPEPYGRPLTLVLGLDDVLIHSEWTREHGWRTAKRPGLDYFLGYLAQYYEIVVFSSNYMVNSEKAVAKLDPYRSSISHALFREATRYKHGNVVKDISSLNRDPSKVIMVECNPEAYSLQPDNAVHLDPWLGTAGDKDLVRLIPFLEWIAAQNVKDVRPILKSFQGTHVPEEYARREAIARKKFEEEFREQYSRTGGGWAAKFLGIQPQAPPTPMMPMDYVRQEGQKGYEAFQKYLAEHGEKILAEEKEREKQILNEQKFTLNKLVTEGLPKPEEIAARQAELEKEAQQQLQQQQKN